MVAINGKMHGFEIKSDRDRLDRLRHQISAYTNCFDTATLVTGTVHLKKAMVILPEWWGVILADQKSETLITLRRPKLNRNADKLEICRFLWLDEAHQVANCLLPSATTRGMTRNQIHELIAKRVSRKRISQKVRETLKVRGDWRSGTTPFPCGDSSLTSAKSLHSQKNRAWLLSLQSQSHPS